MWPAPSVQPGVPHLRTPSSASALSLVFRFTAEFLGAGVDELVGARAMLLRLFAETGDIGEAMMELVSNLNPASAHKHESPTRVTEYGSCFVIELRVVGKTSSAPTCRPSSHFAGSYTYRVQGRRHSERLAPGYPSKLYTQVNSQVHVGIGCSGRPPNVNSSIQSSTSVASGQAGVQPARPRMTNDSCHRELMIHAIASLANLTGANASAPSRLTRSASYSAKLPSNHVH